MARITIYLGHYGSGKTELSISKAFSLKEQGLDVVLVDLDIVNPYFRSGEQKSKLEEAGIRVIMPTFEGTNVAVPSLPAETNMIFENKNIHAVIDVGGSPSGAAALGRYSQMILREDYETVFVINTMRPFTTTAEDIFRISKEIEHKCRLNIKSVVNNTNVAMDTTHEMVEDAQIIVEDASELMNAQMTEICAMPEIIDTFSQEFKDKYKSKIKPIKIHMRPLWLDEK